MKFITGDIKIFNYFYYRNIKFKKDEKFIKQCNMQEIIKDMYLDDIYCNVINNLSKCKLKWDKPNKTTIKQDSYSCNLYFDIYSDVKDKIICIKDDIDWMQQIKPVILSEQKNTFDRFYRYWNY